MMQLSLCKINLLPALQSTSRVHGWLFQLTSFGCASISYAAPIYDDSNPPTHFVQFPVLK